MIPSIFFTMSLAGSMVFILYILSGPLAKKYFSVKWRYRVLKTAAAFYLLPIPYYKYRIRNVIYIFFPGLREKAEQFSGVIYYNYLIDIKSGYIDMPPAARCMLAAVFFIGIVAVIIIQRRIVQYRKWKTVFKKDFQKPADWEQELLIKVKKETGIKEDVELICSRYCRSPMTGGVLSPVLIFPVFGNRIEADKYEYMLRHELTHIKHHDLLIKYIGLLVMAVHWYNPLVYIMFHEISAVSEMYCDSAVVGGRGEAERIKYSSLILELAAQNDDSGRKNGFAGMAESRRKNVYRRRILEMKRYKKQKTVLSMVIMAFICMAGGMTALAYDDPKIISYPHSDDECSGEGVFVLDSVPDPTETEMDDFGELPSDSFFIDDSGNIYDISSSDKAGRADCGHNNWKQGTYKKHIRDGEGGCVIKIYDASLCSDCSKMKKVKLKTTVAYSPCPH